jgi:pilus assembly protein CpaB
MNTNRLLIGLVIALVVAFLLSSFVYKQFQKVSTNKPSVETQPLVVAAVPLPLGTRLDTSNTKIIQWPANQSLAGMFGRVEDCANRAVVTDLAANEPVLEAKLAPKESGGGLSATIPEGMRALSVAVNEVVGVAGFVIPGTMVDVLVTGRALGGTAVQGDITRTILENVRVLAAGQKIQQDRDGKPQTVAVITLLVSPEDAAKLTMAVTDGKIQLALRNTIDTKKNEPPAIVQAALFSAQGAVSTPERAKLPRARPATPPPPPPYVIEVITGNKRESKAFPNPSSSPTEKH